MPRTVASTFNVARDLVFRPIRKWVASGIAKRGDQVPDDAPTLVERFNNLIQRGMVIPIPFRRNWFSTAPNVDNVCFFRFREKHVAKMQIAAYSSWVMSPGMLVEGIATLSLVNDIAEFSLNRSPIIAYQIIHEDHDARTPIAKDSRCRAFLGTS